MIPMEKFCARCTGQLNNEKYLLFGLYYCRACQNTIENDPDYAFIFIRLNKLGIKAALRNLRDIES